MVERIREENLETERTPEKIIGEALAEVENKEAANTDIPFDIRTTAKDFFRKKYEGFRSKAADMGAAVKRETRVTKKGLWEAAKDVGGFAKNVIGVTPNITWRILKGLFEFVKTAIEKKGGVSFKEGYKMAQETFTIDEKGNKKE